MAMKDLVGKVSTKDIEVDDETITIRKLSTAQVFEIREIAKNLEGKTEDDSRVMLYAVVRMGVPDAAKMKDADLATIALPDLNHITEEVMKFSGMEAAINAVVSDEGN